MKNLKVWRWKEEAEGWLFAATWLLFGPPVMVGFLRWEESTPWSQQGMWLMYNIVVYMFLLMVFSPLRGVENLKSKHLTMSKWFK